MLTLGKPFVTHPYQAFQGNESNACRHKRMRLQLLNNSCMQCIIGCEKDKSSCKTPHFNTFIFVLYIFLRPLQLHLPPFSPQLCVLGDCSSGINQWGSLPSSFQLVLLTGEHQQKIRRREERKVWIFIPLALILWGSSEAGYLSSMKVKALMRKLFSQVCFFFWIQATVPPFRIYRPREGNRSHFFFFF